MFHRQSNRTEKYPDTILPLHVPDLHQLYIANHRRVDMRSAMAWVSELPGISQWHPASGEFLIATRWRHRSDIPNIQLLSAFNEEERLIGASVDAAREQGMAAYVTVEMYERRRPSFYRKHGFDLLESIVTYAHERPADFVDVPHEPRQTFLPIAGVTHEIVADLIAIDHAAFEWLWRNSEQEFHWWLGGQSVDAWVGLTDGRVSSYFGATLFTEYAHLDRIAVHPDFQGDGLGRDTLTFAMRRYGTHGYKNVSLSTQSENAVSRAMYERAGFRHTPKDDFQMYGVVFDAAQREVGTR